MLRPILATVARRNSPLACLPTCKKPPVRKPLCNSRCKRRGRRPQSVDVRSATVYRCPVAKNKYRLAYVLTADSLKHPSFVQF